MLLSSTKGPVYGLGSPFEVQAVFKSAPTFIFSLDSLSLFCICAQFPGSGCVESFGSVLSKCMYNLPVSQPSVESLLNPLCLSLCNIYLKTSGQFTVIYVPWPGQYPLVRMAAGLSSWHWVWLFHSSLQIKSALSGSEATDFTPSISLVKHYTNQSGAGGCWRGAAQARTKEFYASYLNYRSCSWINASQFVAFHWLVSRAMKWIFLIHLSNFTAVSCKEDFMTSLHCHITLYW